MMNTTEKERVKHWAHTWQKAGEALEEIKRQELRNYDYNKNLPIIDDMLQWACEHRFTGGTIESALFDTMPLFGGTMEWRKDSH